MILTTLLSLSKSLIPLPSSFFKKRWQDLGICRCVCYPSSSSRWFVLLAMAVLSFWHIQRRYAYGIHHSCRWWSSLAHRPPHLLLAGTTPTISVLLWCWGRDGCWSSHRIITLASVICVRKVWVIWMYDFIAWFLVKDVLNNVLNLLRWYFGLLPMPHFLVYLWHWPKLTMVCIKKEDVLETLVVSCHK